MSKNLTPEQILVADLNNDSIIDILDIVSLVNMILNPQSPTWDFETMSPVHFLPPSATGNKNRFVHHKCMRLHGHGEHGPARARAHSSGS